MKKPEDKVIRALDALDHNQAFGIFTEWLRDSLIYQSVKNNHSKGEDTIIMQGRCLEIEDILNHIQKANQYAQNLKESK